MPATLKEYLALSRAASLFVALHPQCTCSRATTHELSRVLAQATDRTATTVAMGDLV